MTDTPHRQRRTAAGAALLIAAGLSLLAMLHHPVINAPTAAEAIKEVRAEAFINGAVHGVLIFFMTAQLWAFLVFARREQGTLTDFAAILFAAGVFGFAVAAIMSGFVVPELAYRFIDEPEAFRSFGRLVFSINQAFSKFAIAAWAGAALCTAIHFVVRKSRALVLGGVSGAASAALVAALAEGGTLDVRLMTLALIAALAWLVCIGINMIMTGR